MWLRVHEDGEVDDIVLKGLSNAELISILSKKSNEYNAQQLWDERQVFDADLNWIFPSDLLETECSLNLLEQIDCEIFPRFSISAVSH